MPTISQSRFSTVSHWQATNLGEAALLRHGQHDRFPEHVDYLIVGAGITGASLAYQLTRSGGNEHGKSIVLVEAKDVAAGATGRNGGNIAPASFTQFPILTAALSQGGAGLSEEDALKVLENEFDNLKYTQALVAEEGLDVDFHLGEKVEGIAVSEDGVRRMILAYEQFLRARRRCRGMAKMPGEWDLVTDEGEAKRMTRCSSAMAVARGPAGSIHPHKFTVALLRLAMSSTVSPLQYFSWCPVQSLKPDSSGWRVDCASRGSIQADHVVLCVNGQAEELFPPQEQHLGICKHMTPYRGHAALITPPSAFSGPDSLKFSYSVENGPYIMVTQDSGLIMGVYTSTALRRGLIRKHEVFGVTDDSVILPSVRHWLSAYCTEAFDGWKEAGEGEGLMRIWTGKCIMAASRDHLPLIGAVPGKPKLWAAVGFHGHGMARILVCTRGLAYQLQNEIWDERLPQSFEITQDRLLRAERDGCTLDRQLDIAVDQLEKLSL